MATFAGSLDANVLLRMLLNDIPGLHDDAKRLYAQSPQPFLVADTAIVQVIFVLARHYDFTRTAVHEAITGLLELEKITANSQIIIPALGVYIHHPKLSFEDCYLATSALHQNATPLYTFDHKLASQVDVAKIVPSGTEYYP